MLLGEANEGDVVGIPPLFGVPEDEYALFGTDCNDSGDTPRPHSRDNAVAT